MDMMYLYELREHFNQSGILICFSGPFSHSIIEELGHAVRRYLETERASKTVMMDVFSIFIEMTQNVRNYGVQKTAQGNPGIDYANSIIVIGKQGDAYCISAGNFVARADLDALIATVDTVRGMNQDALKLAWKERLRSESPPNTTGAGLGLIAMSRMASRPLEYSVREINESHAFFSIKATV